MSSSVTLVFDHRLDADGVLGLPQRLDPAAFPELARALERLAALSNNPETTREVAAPWRAYTMRAATQSAPAEAWARGQVPFVYHPADVRLGLMPQAGIVSLGWKWTAFLADGALRAAHRDFFAVLAPVLGATAVLYVEGEGCSSRALDGFFEGADFPAIVRRLRDECGSPAASLDELARLRKQGHLLHMYYLDTAIHRRVP